VVFVFGSIDVQYYIYRFAYVEPSLHPWMGIEEGEEIQAKGIHNIFNKITQNSPNLEKPMLIQGQEACRIPNRPDQNRTTPRHIIIKTTSTETREKNIEGCKREKTNNMQR
jgi:hypothetical protein